MKVGMSYQNEQNAVLSGKTSAEVTETGPEGTTFTVTLYENFQRHEEDRT